jgi:short subunit dehydrogenase-like uncharacterized protein
MSEIAVAGATGYTGPLVARALEQRGCSVRLIGRDAARLARTAELLNAASTRAVREWDEAGITRALAGCAALVSCAGPFLRAGWPVVRAAINARVHYADSTGEQTFMRRVFEQLDQPARDADISLLPAGGYDYVPGDLGSALAAEGLGPLESIEACYAVERGAMSTGTRRTAMETLRHTPYERVHGELRRTRIGALRRRVTTPFGALQCLSIPGGEAITVPRHLDVQTVRTFAGALDVSTSPLLIRALTAVARVEPLRKLLETAFVRSGPKPNAVEHARFACIVNACAVDGRTRTVELHARNPYEFTARCLAEIAVRMASAPAPRGALAPAQLLVDARAFLDAVGVEVRQK